MRALFFLLILNSFSIIMGAVECPPTSELTTFNVKWNKDLADYTPYELYQPNVDGIAIDGFFMLPVNHDIMVDDNSDCSSQQQIGRADSVTFILAAELTAVQPQAVVQNSVAQSQIQVQKVRHY